MREDIILNRAWKFSYGDIKEAMNPDYNASCWYDVDIPHTFSLPYFMESEFYTGYGSYRKRITVKKEWLTKELFLEFRGAFQDAEIYFNKTLVMTHKGGYTEFLVPISACVHEGENLLYVRLNNLWNGQIAPRGGEHVFSGGIYRDVSLLIREKIHTKWHGIFVTTPSVSKEKATVSIETNIANKNLKPISVLLDSAIYYGERCVWKDSINVNIQPDTEGNHIQRGEILEPKLWHPDTPNLYRLVTKAYVGDTLTDETTTDFGIRWFEFTKDKGFFLNGEAYDIWGANVHQDHAGWGDGVTQTAIRRDIKMIKDCGMNFIRGSHYPHHTCFAKECDKLGVLFWSELCYWGTAGEKNDGYWTASAYPINEKDEENFEKNCMDTLKEMIIQNRNSPSIIVWSMCNEVFFSREDVMDKAKKLLQKLVDYSHELDSTRPAGVGGVQRGGFDVIGDVAGYNGDGAALFLDPGFPNIVSEYGSCVSDRPGELIPNFSDNAEKNYAWRSGKALWCAFHHGSIFGDMAHMGMIDYFRLPLASWHWYRKELLGIEPPKSRKEGIPHRLLIEADKYEVIANGTDDAFITISLVDKEGRVLSNVTDVTLSVIEGPGYFPTGPSISFSPKDNSFLDGQCAIEFRTYYNGINRIKAVAEGLICAEVVIEGMNGIEWTDKERRWQQRPPYLTSMKKADIGTLLSEHKPVFCSSFQEGYPSGNLTNKDKVKTWKPELDVDGEWVMVDLEGSWEVGCIRVLFCEEIDVPIKVSISTDKEIFSEIENIAVSKDGKTAEAFFSSCRVRFVKIFFPNKAQELIGVNLYV